MTKRSHVGAVLGSASVLIGSAAVPAQAGSSSTVPPIIVTTTDGESAAEALISATADPAVRTQVLSWLEESEEWLRNHPDQYVRGLSAEAATRVLRTLRRAVDLETAEPGAGADLIREQSDLVPLREFHPADPPLEEQTSASPADGSRVASAGPAPAGQWAAPSTEGAAEEDSGYFSDPPVQGGVPTGGETASATPSFNGVQNLRAYVCSKTSCNERGRAQVDTYIDLYFYRARVGYRVQANPLGFWRNVSIGIDCHSNCGEVNFYESSPGFETGGGYLEFARDMRSGTYYLQTTVAGTPSTGAAGSVSGYTPDFRCRAPESQCKFGW